MKRLIILFGCLTLIMTLIDEVHAQSENQNLPFDLWMNPMTKDFNTIQNQVEAWFEGKEKGRGTGYKQWKRWEEWNESRLNTNGEIVNKAPLLYDTYKAEISKLKETNENNRNVDGDWKPWSATHYVNAGSWSPGIGRLNTVAFHPTDANTFYVGTPAGGLFRTTDHGSSWTCLTDDLSSIGVSGIAIHPTDPDIIYILTGDGDAGDTRSIGVYKTMDEGTNWNETGLTWSTADNVRGYKLMMEPGDPTYLLAATSDGIYRTTNSGTNWSNTTPGISGWRDIEYKPNQSSSSIVYASTQFAVYKSTNYGGSWTQKFNVPGTTDRIQIAVTPDSADYVYIVAGPGDSVNVSGNMVPGFRGVFRSTNSGEDYFQRSITPNILTSNVNGVGDRSQSWYDLAIVAAPDDAGTVFVGGVNIWESFNGGTSWGQQAVWDINVANANSGIEYVHADIHWLQYNPLNGRLFAGTDGGIFFTADQGVSWTDITAGLGIGQFRHFAGTDQNVDLMLGGLQDNGTGIFIKDTVKVELGADGADCLIDPTNIQIMYAQTQNGNLRKTTDGGLNWSNISPPERDGNTNPGPFVTRWAMDPNNSNIIYVGWTRDTVYRTTNGGTSWTKANMATGNQGSVEFVSVASNSNTVYACTEKKVFKSNNSGNTWSEIFDDPNSEDFTSVIPQPGNPGTCIITRGGFDSNTKVWVYTDADGAIPIGPGLDPADTLPPVPVNIAAIPTNNPSVIYVGTDLGVYYRDVVGDPFGGWEMFKKNLPNTPVTDIEIYEDEGIMRIATFGRGIWQSDIYDDCPYDLNLTQANDPFLGLPPIVTEEAADDITSSRQILGVGFSDVTYKAGDLVKLTNGFLAVEGTTFVAGNAPCTIDLDNVNGGGGSEEISLKEDLDPEQQVSEQSAEKLIKSTEKER